MTEVEHDLLGYYVGTITMWSGERKILRFSPEDSPQTITGWEFTLVCETDEATPVTVFTKADGDFTRIGAGAVEVVLAAADTSALTAGRRRLRMKRTTPNGPASLSWGWLVIRK